MTKHNFKKLVIRQEAMEFCDKINDYTEGLPGNEKLNLIYQLQKCSISMPSNIAEGSGKRSSAHFAEFLTTALTSAFEAETQLLICQKRNYGNAQSNSELLQRIESLQKKIYSFREKIAKEN